MAGAGARTGSVNRAGRSRASSRARHRRDRRLAGAEGQLAPQGVAADADLRVQNQKAVAVTTVRIGGVVMDLIPPEKRAVMGRGVGDPHARVLDALYQPLVIDRRQRRRPWENSRGSDLNRRSCGYGARRVNRAALPHAANICGQGPLSSKKDCPVQVHFRSGSTTHVGAAFASA